MLPPLQQLTFDEAAPVGAAELQQPVRATLVHLRLEPRVLGAVGGQATPVQ